ALPGEAVEGSLRLREPFGLGGETGVGVQHGLDLLLQLPRAVSGRIREVLDREADPQQASPRRAPARGAHAIGEQGHRQAGDCQEVQARLQGGPAAAGHPRPVGEDGDGVDGGCEVWHGGLLPAPYSNGMPWERRHPCRQQQEPARMPALPGSYPAFAVSTARSRSFSAAGERGAWVRILLMRSMAFTVSPTLW